MNKPEFNSNDAESREKDLRSQISDLVVTLKNVYKLAIARPSRTFNELEQANNRLLKAYNSGIEQLKLGRGLLGPNRARFRAAFKEVIECRRHLIREISEVQHHWFTVSQMIGDAAREYLQLQVRHHPFRLLIVLKALGEADVIVLKPAFMIIHAENYLKNAHAMALVAIPPDQKEK